MTQERHGRALHGPTLKDALGEATLCAPEPFRSVAGWAMLLLMVVWCGLWDFACVAMLFPAEFPSVRVSAPPFPIKLVFPLVGGLMTLFFLRRLFVRHAWRFGLGRI